MGTRLTLTLLFVFALLITRFSQAQIEEIDSLFKVQANSMDSLFKIQVGNLDSTFKIRLKSALEDDKIVNLGELRLKRYIQENGDLRTHFNAARYLALDHVNSNGIRLTAKNAKDSLLNANFRTKYEANFDTLANRSQNKYLLPDKIKDDEYYYTSNVTLDSLTIQIKNFAIQNLMIYTSTGEFFFNKAPISLMAFNKRYSDKIYSSEYDRFVLLGELLEFIPDSKNRYYHGEFNVQSLTKEKITTKLLVNTNLNSLLRVKAFSDLAALIEGEPNGVAQFEVDAFFPMNVKNLPNRASYLVHYLRPHISISRFNNEFISLKTDSLLIITENEIKIDSTYTNSIDLNRSYQRAWLRAGIDINLIHYTPISNHLEISADVTTGYSQSNVTMIDGVENDIKAFDWGFHLGLFLIPLNHFGFEVDLEVDIIKRFNDDKITAIDSNVWRLNSSFQVFYMTDKQNRIFLRWSYFDDLSNNPLQNDFSQLQFGYNASINVSK